jgi:hypothetical protein
MWTWLEKQTRRVRTGYPTSVTPEDHNAWVSEQIRAYATPQPYASPLLSASDNFTGETWEMREGYRRFALKEPSVKASLLTKILAVAQLDLIVKPYGKGTKTDREIAQWVKFSVNSSDGGSAGLVQKIGLHSAIDGFSVTEKVLDTIPMEAPDYSGNWTLLKGKVKDTRGIRFKLDVFKNVTGVRSMIAAQGGMDFSPKDFLIYTHLPLFESPFGISDLRAANRAANLIEAAIKLRAILLENFSGPYLVGKAADKGVRDQIMPILREARSRGWIVIPAEAEVQVMNLATSAPDQFQSSIEDLRREIVTAIQGGYLQLLEGGIADGRGNTEVHASIAQLFQWWLAVTICNTFNFNLVPDLVTPNYGYTSGMPTMQLGGIDSESVMKELDRFKKGQEIGITLSKKQVMEVGGFESPEDASDALPPPHQMGQPDPSGGAPSTGAPDLGSGYSDDYSDDSRAVQLEPSVRHYSEEEYAALSYADRSHLVKKQIRDKNGITRTVWVNPNTGDHGDERQRLAPRENAEAAISRAMNEPHNMTADHLRELPEHLNTITVARKRELLRVMEQKVGGKKVELVDRFLAVIRQRAGSSPAPAQSPPPPPVAPPPPPPPPRTITPPGVDQNLLSQNTRDRLAEVVAGRLEPERVRDQLAQRLYELGASPLIGRLGGAYGLSGPSFENRSDAVRASMVAAEIVSHASGRRVQPGPVTIPADSPPVAPPPPRPQPAPRPSGPRPPRQPSAPPTAPPRPAQNVTFAEGEEDAKRKIRRLFGRDVDSGTFAALVNAHDGANIVITESSSKLNMQTTGDGYFAERTIRKAPGGKLIVHNDYFRINFDRNSSPPPDWVQSNAQINGSELLTNQIRAARALGATKLETYAARSDSDNPNRGMNGYYTWPRLGYDDSIPSHKYDELPSELKQLVDANPTGSTKRRSILGLMTTEDGRKWWKKNGTGLHNMEFDLSDGSLSMRTHRQYQEEKELERQEKERERQAALARG